MLPTNVFGRTGHRSTRAIFGAAGLGSMSQARADATLAVIDSYGVNHIDTAAGYGDGRVVIDRNRMTGGGVTAGIDFSFALIGLLAGDETASLIQLLCEYNPAPPYNTGHPDVAPAPLVATARGFVQSMAPELFARVTQTA